MSNFADNTAASHSSRDKFPALPVVPHLMKGVVIVVALVLLWGFVASLRSHAVSELSSNPAAQASGELANVIAKGAEDKGQESYTEPFLAISLGLVALMIAVVWSNQGAVRQMSRDLKSDVESRAAEFEKSGKEKAKLTATVTHLRAREEGTKGRLEIVNSMAPVWVSVDVAEKANSDDRRLRGWWSEEGRLEPVGTIAINDIMRNFPQVAEESSEWSDQGESDDAANG